MNAYYNRKIIREIEFFPTKGKIEKKKQAKIYLFADAYGSGAESDTLAEALVPPGDGVAIAESYVVSVHLMEGQRWQIVRAGVRRSRGCNTKRTQKTFNCFPLNSE